MNQAIAAHVHNEERAAQLRSLVTPSGKSNVLRLGGVPELADD